MTQHIVYLGVGSNLGDKASNCLRALEEIALSGHTKVHIISSLYKTDPVGYQDQDWFINCVAQILTTLAPRPLVRLLQGIEQQMGRTRTFAMGPRIIDLDILFYGAAIVEEPDLIIPHPHLHERGFVLAPLAEIAPDLPHPVLKKTVDELLKIIGEKGVELYAAPPTIRVSPLS